MIVLRLLSGNPMILYISRGLLSSLADARNVIDVVSTCNARADHLVIINTYAVIDGTVLPCCVMVQCYGLVFVRPFQLLGLPADDGCSLVD